MLHTLRGAAPLLGGQPRVKHAASVRQQRPFTNGGSGSRKLTLKRVAAVEPATFQPDGTAAASGGGHSLVDAEQEQQLAVQELDMAQEGLLKWMLFLDSDAQAADLDEMEDPEEVGDEEFEGIYDDVEAMLEEGESSFRVGDKVYGTVYEVDEDGAYVEIGAKTAGFVPLDECSLGKVKSVRSGNWPGQVDQ